MTHTAIRWRGQDWNSDLLTPCLLLFSGCSAFVMILVEGDVFKRIKALLSLQVSLILP